MQLYTPNIAESQSLIIPPKPQLNHDNFPTDTSVCQSVATTIYGVYGSCVIHGMDTCNHSHKSRRGEWLAGINRQKHNPTSQHVCKYVVSESPYQSWIHFNSWWHTIVCSFYRMSQLSNELHQTPGTESVFNILKLEHHGQYFTHSIFRSIFVT